jgi:hypothetical protein
MWKEKVMEQFEVLSRHFLGVTEERQNPSFRIARVPYEILNDRFPNTIRRITA